LNAIPARLDAVFAGKLAPLLAPLLAALAAAPVAAQSHATVPWTAGEHLEYTVRLAGISSGTGIMEVLGLDTMRGHAAWRVHFNIKGSTPLGLYHVDDSYDSWMDVESLNSLRFEQDLYEGGKRKQRNYDIFPARGTFQQEGKAERRSVAAPLDDASFFFFVRTLPLEVGREYPFDRYFDPDANPVVIKVLRRETIDVPAGRFPTIVLQPTIKTNGLFSKDGHAEIWLSDDDRRILVQMKTHFSFISLGLELKQVTFGDGVNLPMPARKP
jgi:hypothetical protein